MIPAVPAPQRLADDRLRAIVAEHRHERGALLPILHAVLEEAGAVDASAIDVLASELNLSRAEVHGVVTFYPDFRRVPAGATHLRICRAEACQSVGAEALWAHARERTGLDEGETSADGSVTLDRVFCFGNCALGPAAEVDGTLHGRVTPDRLDAILGGGPVTTVFVPGDSAARSVGADDVADRLWRATADAGREVRIVRNGSRGMFWLEPLVEVATPDGRIGYGPVTADDVNGLLAAGLLDGGEHPLRLGIVDDLPWLRGQQRLTFERVGIVDPLDPDDHLAHGGQAGLRAALAMAPGDVVEAVVASGLRGRGGAGFPTGIKWRTVAGAAADLKFIACNADEGDSGTYADRMLMEGDPFALIEGMAIAAHAVGATEGYVYIRSEYPAAVEVMREAIVLARERGWLGASVHGTGLAFDVHVRVGAGAYICGEETSMLDSLEGKRGQVRAKPPLPALEGLFGRPTVVNNVLSFASVPWILAHGAEAYAAHGTGRSRGTSVFQLAGNVARGGIVETAFGVTLAELVRGWGGGTRSGRPVRAVQVGGPLGAYLPADRMDLPMDYEAFAAEGAMVGHGGVVVFDDTVDMGAMARFAMAFCAAESCGKCTPCRIGAVRGVETIDRILEGTADEKRENLVLLEDLCELMVDGSLCALGGLTPMPVRSAIRHFPADFGLEGGGDVSLLHETDYGTPRRPGEATVGLTVDGIPVAVPAGTSVMRAAMEAGIAVPKLCASDSLEAFGSCRLCVVEIDGMRGTPASCTTPVAPGMAVHTQTPRVEKLRRGVMELYISDHPLDCLTCSANGDCELQDMAGVTGLREVRYGSGVEAGANHMDAPTDTSNPYFTFEASKCIVCSRCVRACDEVQGTFALTIDGHGFGSKVAAGPNLAFMASECVSCGACVQACPTATLNENTVIQLGTPNRTVLTTCAYCGVGCSFKAELRGDQLVRMVPHKDGGANEGHSCVKGRFAFGYATHRDRVLAPMMRESIADPWREATWDEAISYTARRLREIQAEHGPGAIGGITSSRCTNEEVYVVQKLVRAAFGNNNVDTCARVCHSPTGYGLKQTFGTSAGTQDFKSVAEADVIVVIGANPTDGHPVFASRMKRRLRQGAKLVVIDPRRIDLVRTPHIEASHHLQLAPGTNVAVINAMAHVVVTEGLVDQAFVAERCEGFAEWAAAIADPGNSPEAMEAVSGVPAAELRAAARLYAGARNAAIYYGLGVTEHSQGSTMVMGMANLAMATGNIGRDGVGVNPLRGQNNVQGSCDMGSFPHELPGYRHVSDDRAREVYEQLWGTPILDEPGLRIPNMLDAAIDGTFRAIYIQGEDLAQSDPNTHHVTEALSAMDLVIVQDLFLNETARFAHVFLPGTSFLEKDGTFTNAERRINRVRPVMAAATGKQEWEVVCEVAQAMGYPMHYDDTARIMDEIALTTPSFAGVSHAHLDDVGSVQWPCNEAAPLGTAIMHVDGFVRGKGRFVETTYVPTRERSTRRFPLILTTGRILTQYNVGAQTRRTANVAWHPEDILDLHPYDAEERGIRDGDLVTLESRVGSTTLRAVVSDRMPVGVCYTTFHHPVTGANVVTTEHSDWATNCPEYKVTAVQVSLAMAPGEVGAVVMREPAPDGAGGGEGRRRRDREREREGVGALRFTEGGGVAGALEPRPGRD